MNILIQQSNTFLRLLIYFLLVNGATNLKPMDNLIRDMSLVLTES